MSRAATSCLEEPDSGETSSLLSSLRRNLYLRVLSWVSAPSRTAMLPIGLGVLLLMWRAGSRRSASTSMESGSPGSENIARMKTALVEWSKDAIHREGEPRCGVEQVPGKPWCDRDRLNLSSDLGIPCAAQLARWVRLAIAA